MSEQEDPTLQRRHTHELDPRFVTNCANCHYWRYDSDLEVMMKQRYSDYEKLGKAGLCTRRSPTPSREIPVMVPELEGPRLIGEEQKMFVQAMTKVLTMSHTAWPWTFGVEGCGEGKAITPDILRAWAEDRLNNWKGSDIQYLTRQELEFLLEVPPRVDWSKILSGTLQSET